MALPTVGLTGGVASGKSTVAAAFRSLQVPVCDADQLAREVVAPGSTALATIARTFGQEMLTADGELNRPAMRKLEGEDATIDFEHMCNRLPGIENVVEGRIRAEFTVTGSERKKAPTTTTTTTTLSEYERGTTNNELSPTWFLPSL